MIEADVLEIFPLRHAFVGRDSTSPPDVLDTEWVGLLHIGIRYCLEHLDRGFDEIRPLEVFSTEAEAQARAEAEYELRREDWREGGVRPSRPMPFMWLRHAYVGRHSTCPPDAVDTEWVGVFREAEGDGSAHYCVEHL